MKEIVVISGKGGTGKTSIVAAFAALAEKKVMVDCDVDAADLHIILKPEIKKTTEFFCGKEARINSEVCTMCGRCLDVCRFDAIKNNFEVDEIKCEGCGSCYYQCPAKAIELIEKKSGDWYESATRFGPLIHARLGIAEENSGKLVSEVKNYARRIAKKENLDLILVDGSPGIGCPVIASISGAHLVLIVTEPTLSGMHDAKRVVELTQHFKIPASICINKCDLNPEITEEIKSYCQENNITLAGEILYSPDFTEAQLQGLSLIEYTDNETSNTLKTIWKKINSMVMEKEKC
jgi:MinD superfamily P-loop ATPase